MPRKEVIKSTDMDHIKNWEAKMFPESLMSPRTMARKERRPATKPPKGEQTEQQ